MSVYIDDMQAPYGRMIMCHMIADTSEELHRMAAMIGVQRKWCQKEGTHREHYDISLVKKSMALRAGAQAITQRELSVKIEARKPSTEENV